MTASSPSVWVSDSSVFINFCLIGRLRLLTHFRMPLSTPEYVFRHELTGPRAHADTRKQAVLAVKDHELTVAQLTLDDLERLAQLEPPRRLALGELACGLIAVRESAGLLIDDQKARNWLRPRLAIERWEATEDVLVRAAHACVISEFDLDIIQGELEANRYACRCHLRTEYLMQRLSRSPTASAGE